MPDTQEPGKLTNLHESMRRAAFRSSPKESTVVSVRVQIHVKDAVAGICERQGTTLSAFLAQVCEDTLKDYVGIQDN